MSGLDTATMGVWGLLLVCWALILDDWLFWLAWVEVLWVVVWEVLVWVEAEVCLAGTGTRFKVERLTVPEVDMRAEPVAPEKMLDKVEAWEDGTTKEPTDKFVG